MCCKQKFLVENLICSNPSNSCSHSSSISVVKGKNGGNKARKALRNKIKFNSEGLVDIQDLDSI